MFQEDRSVGPAVVTPIEPWRQVLLDAAQRIRERGWCRGTVCDSKGRNCAIGAIHKYTRVNGIVTHPSTPGEFYPAQRQFAKIVGGSVSRWNDLPGRTQEEVIAALEAAARS